MPASTSSRTAPEPLQRMRGAWLRACRHASSSTVGTLMETLLVRSARVKSEHVLVADDHRSLS